MIDIVIVTNDESVKFTEECIKSIEETTSIPYKIYEISGDLGNDFNYNKCLNKGASLGNNPYILFCNNDLIFTENWDILISSMKSHNLRSASPYCNNTHKRWWKKV